MQSFIDEIAIASKQDAVKLRLAMLGEPRKIPYSGHGGPQFDTGRLAEVLRRCAAKIGWGERRDDGHGLGIACHFTFGGYTAHAFEVSIEGRELRIHRAVCVVDVGRAVNPLGVEAQMMGGTIDGLSTALHLAITVKDGQVQQHNFPDYPLLRMPSPKPTSSTSVTTNATSPPSRSRRRSRFGRISQRRLRCHGRRSLAKRRRPGSCRVGGRRSVRGSIGVGDEGCCEVKSRCPDASRQDNDGALKRG